MKAAVLCFIITLLLPTLVTATTHEFHNPEAFVQSLKGDKEAGKKIYQQFCVTCHAVQPKIPLGAPRMGVAADWQTRQHETIEQMLAKVNAGFNAMPARGGCFECSDEQIKAAILYMLPNASTSR